MGDSITYGVGDEAEGGYRQPLLAQFPEFVSRGVQTLPTIPEPYLHHDGYPGETSGYILAHTDGSLEDLIGKASPDVVLLHIGTNDYHTLTSDQSRDNIVGVVNQLLARRPYAHIFVMLTINAGSDSTNAALNAFIADLDPKVRAALTGYSSRAHVVEPPTIPDGDFVGGSTGLHPTAAGYALMVDDGGGHGWKPALISAGY